MCTHLCAHTHQNRSSCAGDSCRMHPVPLHQHAPLYRSVLYNKPVNVALPRQFFKLSQKSPNLVVQPSQKRRQLGDKLCIIQSVTFIIINVHRLTYHCNICTACFFWLVSEFYVTGALHLWLCTKLSCEIAGGISERRRMGLHGKEACIPGIVRDILIMYVFFLYSHHADILSQIYFLKAS